MFLDISPTFAVPVILPFLSLYIPCFQKHKEVFRTVSAKKVIRNYNRIASALIEFEILHYNAWKQSLVVADEGMYNVYLIMYPICAFEHIQCTFQVYKSDFLRS